MGDTFLGLLSDKNHAQLSAVDLEVMGKRAADRYLCKEASLNDAIVEMVQEHPDMSQDQVRRVVENANVDTFQRLFEKQAGDKNVDFDIADPAVVLERINKEAKPREKTAMPFEYGMAPPSPDYSDLEADKALCESFGMKFTSPVLEKVGNEIVKEAMAAVKCGGDKDGLIFGDLQKASSLEAIKKFASERESYPFVNPFGELIRTRQRLNKLAEDSRSGLTQSAYLIKEATDHFAEQVTQYLFQGGNIGEVVHAMGSVSDPEFTKQAFQEILPKLEKKGADLTKLQSDTIVYEITKAASARVLNTNSEIIETYSALVKLAQGHLVLAQANSQIENQLQEVTSVLQEAMRRGHAHSSQ